MEQKLGGGEETETGSRTTYTTHGTHGVVNSPGPQPALDDFEPAALTEDHVGRGDADIVEEELAVAVRRVVVPKHRQHALGADPRRVGRDEDDRLPLVHLWVVRRRLAHHHVDLAAQVAGAGGPPFLEKRKTHQRGVQSLALSKMSSKRWSWSWGALVLVLVLEFFTSNSPSH